MLRAISLSALIDNIIADDTRRYIGNAKRLAELHNGESLRFSRNSKEERSLS